MIRLQDLRDPKECTINAFDKAIVNKAPLWCSRGGAVVTIAKLHKNVFSMYTACKNRLQ